MKQKLGLIVMSIDDANQNIENDLDESLESILVIFNSNTDSKNIKFSDSEAFQLHPIQKMSVDKQLQNVRITQESITVPALTTVVLIKPVLH